jgi:hypothetical protein
VEDYLDAARRVFEGTRYKAADEDVGKLADNMALLEKRGLSKLNKRLIDARKHSKIFETIAEHNFAVMLVLRHSSAIPISYEPDLGSLRPPDFKVETGNVTYWIQMKDLSKLERENRQDKLIEKIKAKAKEIKVGKFFSCLLSDDFKKDCLPELMIFMKEQAPSAIDEKSVLFTSKNNQRAEITFWSPEKIELSELTLGYAGDLDIVEITGLSRDQIKQSLLNAVGAFEWEADENNINLIVMEADNKEDIDICDALFGTEYEVFNSMRGHLGWSRKNDGLFSETDFSKKIAGVIAIKRKLERVDEVSFLSPDEIVSRLSPEEKEISEGMSPEEIKEALKWKSPGPIADYSLILYVNNSLKHLVEKIKRLLSFDRIIYYNMRPPIGEGNFEC